MTASCSTNTACHQCQESRDSEISKIQRALETEIVKSKLEAHGLAPDEITAKLQGMTDAGLSVTALQSTYPVLVR
jgi:hypothetical protein